MRNGELGSIPVYLVVPSSSEAIELPELVGLVDAVGPDVKPRLKLKVGESTSVSFN